MELVVMVWGILFVVCCIYITAIIVSRAYFSERERFLRRLTEGDSEDG